MKLQEGFAGKLSKQFVHSKLTPVIIITSLLIGIFAVFVTPKEEEPQISVPMIDIQVGYLGYEAKEIERKIVEPIERAVWGLDGVEYVYSASKAHGALITIRFKVGEPIEPSLVKVHHKLMTVRPSLPKEMLDPIVKSYSIDDVPFLVLTYSSDKIDDYKLRSIITPLARELSSTPDLSRVEVLGGLKRTVRVIADSNQMTHKGISLLSVAEALKRNDYVMPGEKTWQKDNTFNVEIGGRIEHAEDVKKIPIGQRAGQIVKIEDIATVVDGPEERTKVSMILDRNSVKKSVSIVFAKRKGTNVVELSKKILAQADVFSKNLSADIEMNVIRNYGKTAEAKSNELIEHLIIATLSVSILIALFMGVRAAFVVAIAIPVTLALTLAIYYFLGYTLNRVTLFALIFSIGILVDDAIVVVENIERHLHIKSNRSILRATIDAVAEVGNPTILATFTVIASILPMAFVRGMMGPYMKPIPVGASLAMIVSLFVAFIVTPWAAIRLMKTKDNPVSEVHKESKLDKLYINIMNWLLSKKKNSLQFGLFTLALLIASFSLVYLKIVKVKMLPFDNKNEFQVIIDYPSSTTLDKSVELTKDLTSKMLENKNIEKIQLFSGEPAPYSFSGMVKHTFLRGSDEQIDLQVLLKDKELRKESSHEIIESIRPIIQQFAKNHNAITKVLEIPPGPPVLSTMLAEIYGPDENTRKQVSQEIYDIFRSIPSVVDLDTTYRLGRQRMLYQFDYTQAGILGLSANHVAQIGAMSFSENKITTLKDVTSPEEINVVLSLDEKTRSSDQPLNGQTLPSFESGTSEINKVLKKPKFIENETRHRKNLKPVAYVMSELTGAEEAPVYGLALIQPKIKYEQQTAEVPWDTQKPVIKWDGEWFITYEVFRDLGGAFAIVMILIYILVLGWFKNFSLPLIIMAPIPISLIGILPGHALAGFYFGAPSMIGFIAGAGIIVRNSIILVDFIEHQLITGMQLKEAVISAGVIRFRPMLLTAAAVVVGSAVMLMDPIFQGLAISLIFGEVAATLISRFAVPSLYYWLIGKSRVKQLNMQEVA